jgi:hypothetical protein
VCQPASNGRRKVVLLEDAHCVEGRGRREALDVGVVVDLHRQLPVPSLIVTNAVERLRRRRDGAADDRRVRDRDRTVPRTIPGWCGSAAMVVVHRRRRRARRAIVTPNGDAAFSIDSVRSSRSAADEADAAARSTVLSGRRRREDVRVSLER